MKQIRKFHLKNEQLQAARQTALLVYINLHKEVIIFMLSTATEMTNVVSNINLIEVF